MRNKNIFGKDVAAMSEETLFEKLGVKYIEKDGILLFVDCIMWREEKHRCWEIWSHVD